MSNLVSDPFTIILPTYGCLQYSNLKWNFNHFTGVDYNNDGGKNAIFRIHGDGKSWAEGVDGENKNYDYLSTISIFLVPLLS